MKTSLLFAFFLAAAGTVFWLIGQPVPDLEPDHQRDPESRVAAAREHCASRLHDRFHAAGVAWPPREVFFRAFKHEAEFEVWARNGGERFTLVHSYAITHSSGNPGPKRREGDRQVPEGFYEINGYNPRSLYHLSLRVNYPNASDRLLSDREKPGFDIYVHGGDQSVGCVPLGDRGIEEVYLIALEAGNSGRIPLHIFPARMSGRAWEFFAAPWRQRRPELDAFWNMLQPGFDEFEKHRTLPRIATESDGRYRVIRSVSADDGR